jgi:hypothetical protein
VVVREPAVGPRHPLPMIRYVLYQRLVLLMNARRVALLALPLCLPSYSEDYFPRPDARAA